MKESLGTDGGAGERSWRARGEGGDGRTRPAVAAAVQTLAAARLGRGFIPLAVILIYAVVQMIRHGLRPPGYAILAAGALVSAGAMLLYGQWAVTRALGRGKGVSGAVLAVVGLVPYGYAFYALGAWGLEPLAGALDGGTGWVELAVAVGFVLVSGRLLWMLTRLTELHRAAGAMVLPAPEEKSGDPEG